MIDRNLRRSVMARVRALFEAPPSDLIPYTVYDEDQLRRVNAGTLKPVRPCVFLVDTYIRPTEMQLPLVSVETIRVNKRSFELGNRNGRRTDIRLHVFGRQRGERDDLGSFLADNFGVGVPIYTYPTNGDAPTLLETGIVRDDIDLENHTVDEPSRQDGALDLWQIVTLSIETKQ